MLINNKTGGTVIIILRAIDSGNVLGRLIIEDGRQRFLTGPDEILHNRNLREIICVGETPPQKQGGVIVVTQCGRESLAVGNYELVLMGLHCEHEDAHTMPDSCVFA